MSEQIHTCPECSRKIMQNVSNRCMYCGATLPEEHHLSQEEKAQLLSDKMDQFKSNEENAEDLIRSMRKDFGIPEKKTRKNKKQENADALADAIASIKSVASDIETSRETTDGSPGDNSKNNKD